MPSVTDNQTLLKHFYRNLDDCALAPDDERYFPLYADGEDPISEIANHIDWSDSSSVSLLTGQRGTGKSTELKRLKMLLEAEGCDVFLCDIEDYLNLSTRIEITDLFIALMSAFSDQVKERYGRDLTHESYLDRFIRFMKTEVDPTEIGVKYSGVNIKLALKNDPGFKQQLQQQLHGHASNIIRQAHEFAMDAVQAIREEHNDSELKVVVLLDSLEHLRGSGEEAYQLYRQVHDLFAYNTESLQIPLLHVLYTVPPFLSHMAPALANRLGNSTVQNLPTLHIRYRDGGADQQGFERAYQILRKRCDDLDRLFQRPQINRMVALSGGDLRDLFRLIRLVLTKGKRSELPLPDALLEQAINHMRREYPLTTADINWAHRVKRSKRMELDDLNQLPELARLLDARIILNYRNGDDWYDVHPVLDLPEDDKADAET